MSWFLFLSQKKGGGEDYIADQIRATINEINSLLIK
jgi:hypothetical protein